MGRPKGGVVVDGRPLARTAGETLLTLCGYVVVVTRPEVQLPDMPPPLAVANDMPGPDAPLTGIVTGVAIVPGHDAVILACDLPFAAPAVAALAAVPAGVPVVATAGGRVQPLCARYPREAALDVGTALLAAGETRAMALADALGAVRVEVPARALANLNTPADLAAVA